MTKKKSKAQQLGLIENIVHMGVFDFEVSIIIGTYSKVGAYIEWKFEEKDFNPSDWGMDMDNEPLGTCFFSAGYDPIIWIPKKPKTSREHATYAHECLHAVWHLFEWADIPITSDTEEVMTHAMSHLITNGIK
jgi:hypothetical protein